MHEYVCAHNHTYTHVCTHMYIHIHTCTHTYTRVHTHTHRYTHVHTHSHIYTHIHTHIHTHKHTYAHIRRCTHTCTRVHICTHTHTHTYVPYGEILVKLFFHEFVREILASLILFIYKANVLLTFNFKFANVFIHCYFFATYMIYKIDFIIELTVWISVYLFS